MRRCFGRKVYAMTTKPVTNLDLFVLSVVTLSWVVYGIDVGVPFAMNALGDAGVIQIGDPSGLVLLLSILGLLLVMPAWIGIPIYGFYFITLIRDENTLSSAVRKCFEEYCSTSSAAAIFLIVGSIIGIVGRTLATAVYTAGIFAVLGGLVIYSVRRLLGKAKTPNNQINQEQG
jgi:hypothetical protein